MITSNVAFYPCISIEETEKFYSDIIGLECIMKTKECRIFSAVKGHFGFMEYDDKKAATGRLCISLNCRSNEEVDEEYQRILALGAEVTGAPGMHPTQPVYSFFIKDPNGYLVEYQKLQNLDI